MNSSPAERRFESEAETELEPSTAWVLYFLVSRWSHRFGDLWATFFRSSEQGAATRSRSQATIPHSPNEMRGL